MGLGPIPRSAIMAYAAEHDLFGDAAEHFAAIIRRVDVDYLRMSNASADKKLSGNEVSVSDIEGSKQVMQRISSRAGSATKRQVKKGNGES